MMARAKRAKSNSWLWRKWRGEPPAGVALGFSSKLMKHVRKNHRAIVAEAEMDTVESNSNSNLHGQASSSLTVNDHPDGEGGEASTSL